MTCLTSLTYLRGLVAQRRLVLDAGADEVRLLVALLTRLTQVPTRGVQVLLALLQIGRRLLQLAARVGEQLLHLMTSSIITSNTCTSTANNSTQRLK